MGREDQPKVLGNRIAAEPDGDTHQVAGRALDMGREVDRSGKAAAGECLHFQRHRALAREADRLARKVRTRQNPCTASPDSSATVEHRAENMRAMHSALPTASRGRAQ